MSTPGRPFAFIATTVHDPSFGFQTTVRAPAPVVEATQKPCFPGADTSALPLTVSALSPRKSEMRVWFTPARYRSTSVERPIPTNSCEPGLAGVTRIRTFPSRPGAYSQPTPAEPRSVCSVARADPVVEK
jgi:hypothetical protein